MTNTSYLQRIGNRWYVRVKIPRELRAHLRNTHIRRTLGTGDLAEANRRKWPALALIQSELERVRLAHGGRVRADGAGAHTAIHEGSALALPERLTRPLVGEVQKLDALVERWLDSADYLAQTKQQHQQAYRELRTFLGGNQLPSAVTDDLALRFVEERIKGSGWAYATKRRKVNSLVTLWEWLAMQRLVPRNANPWRGFRLGTRRTATTPAKVKRPYTNSELLRLFSRRPSYPGLDDVMVLALLTGMRLDEICSLRMGDISSLDGVGFVLHVRRAKTRAGVRSLAVLHSLGTQIVARRWNTKAPTEHQLFPEFRPGGYDGKLSWAVSKAFGRHRTRMGLTGETDFHSFRRTFITLMENAGVDQVRIARYVGHELPTLAFAVYSGGATERTMVETAKVVEYPRVVERALVSFMGLSSK